MKETKEEILAQLCKWNDARTTRPKEGARVVVFSLHRNGVYEYNLALRRGKRYWKESMFVPTERIPCVRYWKYAHGGLNKYAEK